MLSNSWDHFVVRINLVSPIWVRFVKKGNFFYNKKNAFYILLLLLFCFGFSSEIFDGMRGFCLNIFQRQRERTLVDFMFQRVPLDLWHSHPTLHRKAHTCCGKWFHVLIQIEQFQTHSKYKCIFLLLSLSDLLWGTVKQNSCYPFRVNSW